MNSPECVVHRLGLVPYQQAWELQEALAQEIALGQRPATLLLLEHPHTYTFGRRGQPENLLWDPAERACRGVEVLWVDRGGDVTYHGPGQLVGYPLLPLAAIQYDPDPNQDHSRLPQADYIGYLRKLESTLILALMHLGVASGQVQGLTGVWVQPEALSSCRNCRPEMRQRPAKLAAIGVKVDARGVSRHGFALNVDPDMDYWEGITGCGLQDYPNVSLADLLPAIPSQEQVADAIVAAFGEVFSYQMVEKTFNRGKNENQQ
ncbi:MAG: lipoyl(octanoyl) transferase LipB [Chloroflexota bacterium]